MDFIFKNKYVIIIAFILFTVICGIVYCYSQNKQYDEEYEFTYEFQNNSVNDVVVNEIKTINKIKVHISGEVVNPGVIEIEENSRIIDAINVVGGLTKEADITDVNLAYILEDAQKIYIPNINNKDNNIEIVSTKNQNEKQGRVMININTASVDELQKLSGIGESFAKKIINYRNENGKFTSIEEIKNVSGVGESKYELIKDNICVK